MHNDTMTRQPTTDVELTADDFVLEEAFVFGAIAVVLFVTGLVSGYAGVYVLAAVAGVVAVGFTVVHTAKSMVTPTSQG